MRLTFKNDIGSITMGGGDHPSVNIIEAIGFGLPGKEFSNVTYAGQSGHTTTNVRDVARTITLSGTFVGDKKEILKMYNILYSPGVLIYQDKGVKRQITCRLTNNDDFKPQGKSGIYTFALQFSADDPYFTDTEDLKFDIYKRVDKVTGTIYNSTGEKVVFTERTTEISVINSGVKAVYPVIIVQSKELSGIDNTQLEISVERDDLVCAIIKLNCNTPSNDSITFDLPRRRIVSRSQGDITNYISDETILSEFYLLPGNNIVKFDAHDGVGKVTAELMYRNKYAAISL